MRHIELHSNMRTPGRFSFGLLLTIVLAIAGCASTFLVSKNCITDFLGSEDAAIRNQLCNSGDLLKILDDTQLTQSEKNSLYQAQCTNPSEKTFRKNYAALDTEKKKDLQFTFQKHGYYVNYKPAPNYEYNYYARSNQEFCPPDRY